jgi:hypothetical protein
LRPLRILAGCFVRKDAIGLDLLQLPFRVPIKTADADAPAALTFPVGVHSMDRLAHNLDDLRRLVQGPMQAISVLCRRNVNRSVNKRNCLPAGPNQAIATTALPAWFPQPPPPLLFNLQMPAVLGLQYDVRAHGGYYVNAHGCIAGQVIGKAGRDTVATASAELTERLSSIRAARMAPTGKKGRAEPTVPPPFWQRRTSVK